MGVEQRVSEKDKQFIKKYEELLYKGYCDCNEMNCIDNNSPRRILNIVKDLQNQLQQKENIIKEVREYIEKMTYDNPDTDFELEVNTVLGNALEILDKGEDKEC